MTILRTDQIKFLEDARGKLRAGHQKILAVAPTGFGKGVVTGHIVASALARQKSVLFIVRGRELVSDQSRRLEKLGIDHGVIMANHPRGTRPWLNVALASIDTLCRRKTPPKADLLIADEAHLSLSASFSKVFELYPNVPLIGMTATPILGSGDGLGSVYKTMVIGPSVADMIAAGNLVPTRVFAPESRPDLTGVKKSGGEYQAGPLAYVSDKPKLIGDAVKTWKRLASDRKTVAFAVNVAHSQHIAEQFRCAGVTWTHVDGDTQGRDRIWDDLANGTLRGVSSCGVINIGWDCPPVSCAISLRATASLGLFLQQWGRILRTHPGKKDAIYLDHSGNVGRHSFVDDPREWSLDHGVTHAKDYDPSLAIRTCKKCWRAYSCRQDNCPHCGEIFVAPKRVIEEVPGELKEIGRFICSVCRREMEKQGEACACGGMSQRAYMVKKLSNNPRIAEIQREAAEKGWKPGAVWHRIQKLRVGVRA